MPRKKQQNKRGLLIKTQEPIIRTPEDEMEALERSTCNIDALKMAQKTLEEAGYGVTEPAAGPSEEDLEPPIPREKDPYFVLQPEESLPDVYIKSGSGVSALVPCPRCRRIRMDNTRQAVVCTQSGTDIAWFYCRFCGNQWKLAVEIAPEPELKAPREIPGLPPRAPRTPGEIKAYEAQKEAEKAAKDAERARYEAEWRKKHLVQQPEAAKAEAAKKRKEEERIERRRQYNEEMGIRMPE